MSITLTISIPTWNRYEFLQENVLSIINAVQKLPPQTIELFVTDNASDDKTEEFMRDMAKKHSFITYYRQSENKGANANFYTALNHAQGEYVWLFGDDDKIIEENLNFILNDIETYKPSLLIGKARNDVTNQIYYLEKIKQQTLIDQEILHEYHAIQLAGKISTVIFNKKAFLEVAETGKRTIEALKTPWPHLIWFLQLLAKGHQLLILPYPICYFIEKNRYNTVLQDGVVQMELFFRDYSLLIKSLQTSFKTSVQPALIANITRSRKIELIKTLAYSTYLNRYFEALRVGYTTLKVMPSWYNKYNLCVYYLAPALLPIKLRYFVFNLIKSIAPNWQEYQTVLHYLKNVKKLQKNANPRSLFNREWL